MKNIIKSIALLIVFIAFSIQKTNAQNINYKVISDEPAIPGLVVSIVPINLNWSSGLGLGGGAFVNLRPIKRLNIEAKATSDFYFNSYRFDYEEGTPKNGFKNFGGLSAHGVAEFAWRQKGLDINGDPWDKFYLSQDVTSNGFTTTTTTNYIPFHYKTLVERTLRGGIFFDEFPFEHNTLRQISVSAGIGKKWHRRAEIQFENRTDYQYTQIGWGFDILYGVPTFEVDSLANGGAIGLRFVMERNQVFSRRPGLRGFSMNYSFEGGIKPGGVAYLGIKLGVPVIKTGGPSFPDKTYKEINRPKKFLGKFFRAI